MKFILALVLLVLGSALAFGEEAGHKVIGKIGNSVFYEFNSDDGLRWMAFQSNTNSDGLYVSVVNKTNVPKFKIKKLGTINGTTLYEIQGFDMLSEKCIAEERNGFVRLHKFIGSVHIASTEEVTIKMSPGIHAATAGESPIR